MSERVDILGVAGRPVLHSRSPAIFRELFRITGDNAAYMRVASSSAEEAIGLFRALGMSGMNLTAPFKEEAVHLVDELSPEARALGAVNCLVPIAGEGDRALIRGCNTDPQGVAGALRVHGIEPSGKRCLVIGAGGAAKAAVCALVSAGCAVTVANRTRARADELAERFGCGSGALDSLRDLARGADIITSTIASDALPDPEAWFPFNRPVAVIDADYKSARLARFASARGLATATGADWLVAQAVPAHRLFMRGALGDGEASGGSGPSSDDAASGDALFGRLCEALVKAPPVYSQGRTIALVGLMGAGKSSTGRALADRLGQPFVDADREIEIEAGMSVSRIFESEGEASFRSREARIIDRITRYPEPCVLATGGGAVVAEAVRDMLRDRCLTVWLYASPATAAARATGGGRPLLAGGDPLGRMSALEAERRGAYASCAELLVSTEGRSAPEVAELIHEEIRRLS